MCLACQVAFPHTILGYAIDDPYGILLSVEILSAAQPDQGKSHGGKTQAGSTAKGGQRSRRARLARKSRY